MKKSTFTGLLAGMLLSAGTTVTPAMANVALPEVERPERGVPEGLVKKDLVQKRSGRELLRAASPAGKIIQGYQNTNAYGVERGVWRMNTDGQQERLFSDFYTDKGYSLTTGWIRDGRLCVTADLSIFEIIDLRYLEMDPYTGEILEDSQILIKDPVTTFPNYLPAFWSCAYDPEADKIYGYGPSENGLNYAFFSAPGNDPAEAKCVRTPQYKEVCVTIAFNTDDGLLYGINRNDDLVSIDPATGDQTVVMPTGLSTRYAATGMFYMPESKKFLLETAETDYTYCLAEIDLATKTLTKLCYLDNFEQYGFLYRVDAADDPAPIRAPELDAVRFDHPSASGKISYFLPTEYFAGGSVTGTLTWTALLDGEVAATGESATGEILEVNYDGITPGMHTFGLSVKNGDKGSATHSMEMFVGYDEPYPTEEVVLTETGISWKPVTRCVNGGFLDAANLKYHVYVNGEEIGVTSETSLDYVIPQELPYASYSARVVVDNMGILSAGTRSGSIRCGAPWQPDFHIIPTSTDALISSVYDLNQDADHWEFYDFDDEDDVDAGYFASPRGNGSDSNDWLFLMPILLDDTAVTYELSYDMGNFSTWYPEMELGVYLHDELDPRRIVTTLQEKRAINNTKQYDTYTQRFAITEPGVYYISFFTDAEAYQTGLRVCNIKLRKQRTSTTVPTGVTDLNVTGAPLGELKAIAEFKMPMTYISGQAIPTTTKLEARVTLGDKVESVTGYPGETKSLEIASAQGYNRLNVTTYVDGMEGQGTFADVFTGIDVPGPVSSIDGYVTEDNLTLVAQWTSPAEEGENGYYVNPDDVSYNLMMFGEDGWEVAEELGKGVTEYSFSVAPGSPLATARFGIAPSTVEGICSTVAYLSDALGTPHKLPVKEEFENASFKYGPIRIVRVNQDYADSEWGVVNPRLIDLSMEVESNVACYGRSEGPTQAGMLMLPKFDLQGIEKPGIAFNCWTGRGAADVFIYGETFDSDGMVQLGMFPINGSGWQTIEFPFPENFKDHKWVAIYIDAFFATENHYALFSNYEVRGGMTGVAPVFADGGCVRGGYGEIIVTGLEGKSLEVYTTDGRIVSLDKAVNADRVSIPVVAGAYIVRAGEEAVKVIVR